MPFSKSKSAYPGSTRGNGTGIDVGARRGPPGSIVWPIAGERATEALTSVVDRRKSRKVSCRDASSDTLSAKPFATYVHVFLSAALLYVLDYDSRITSASPSRFPLSQLNAGHLGARATKLRRPNRRDFAGVSTLEVARERTKRGWPRTTLAPTSIGQT